jgi:hypothetical protein
MADIKRIESKSVKDRQSALWGAFFLYIIAREEGRKDSRSKIPCVLETTFVGFQNPGGFPKPGWVSKTWVGFQNLGRFPKPG